MKQLIPLAASLLIIGGCAGGYGGGVYAGEPYSYAGYYDDFYGPIYDGYWGDDGFFYYRGGAGDRRYRRGDAAHFRREPGGASFHSMRGSMTPGAGMHIPHLGGAHGGGRFGRR